jgi:hypothetical protein
MPSGVSLCKRPIKILSFHMTFGNEVEARDIAEHLFYFVLRNLMLSPQLPNELFFPLALSDLHDQVGMTSLLSTGNIIFEEFLRPCAGTD